ncbi:MAG: hypothetical protein M3Q44_04090 [bacterium]|nr:hypothetical protein [bacterium]
MYQPNYPLWKKVLWRLVRTALATAIAGTFALKPDWSEPEQAISILTMTFLSGFIVAIGMGIRDIASSEDKSSLWQKLPV